MAEIQWGNPKITVERVPDTNTINYMDNQGKQSVDALMGLKDNSFYQEYISDLIQIIKQNGGMSESKIYEFIWSHNLGKMNLTYEDVERDIRIAQIYREKGDYSITRRKFDVFQESSINTNVTVSPTNNNVFVIEKKVPLKQDVFALIGKIEGNLAIRPNTKMQVNTFLGETLYVNILGIKWDGRIRKEISRGSDIMLSVSGISIDSVDIGDELTI